MSSRKLDGLPLFILVSADRNEALQMWRRDLVQIGAAGALLLGIIVFMGILIAREVRQRTAAEFLSRSALRKLERQHAIVQTMLRTLPDGVQLLDRDLKLVGWNDRLFEILELDRDAILRAPDPARAVRYAMAERGEFGPGAPDDLVAQREQIATKGIPVYFRRQHRTGRWLECRGTPVDGEGYLGVFRDVSEEVAREAALQEANHRLEQQAAELAGAAERVDVMRRRAEDAYWEAERANRAKSAFLANMSHELRTPLNAINGFSEIIADLHFGPGGLARYRDYARDIHASGQHLLGLINSILDIAKIEAGRMELCETAVDLGNCVNTALKMVESAALAKKLRVTLTCATGPIQVRADEQKLTQSFLNILSNAVKFTPDRGSVSVTVQHVGSELSVIFRDSGIGIDAPDMSRVFTPFARVDSPLARTTEGTGLGMALTKSLVELHGGRIGLASELGVGTTVTIYLPSTRLLPAEVRAAS